jgi:hypothetical protein
MRVIAESFFRKHVVESKFQDVWVLNLPNLEVESLNREDEIKILDPFSHCCYLMLFNNRITHECLETIWVDFPSCWWIYLSSNRISKLSSGTIPLALSLLDLSNNPIPIDELSSLSLSHVLRLNLTTDNFPSIDASFDRSWDALLSISHRLHQIWVFNNHFISHSDRKYVLRNFPREDAAQAIKPTQQRGAWSSLTISARQTTIINATHHLERIDHVSDTVRLDILLEDYMHECLIWNQYCHAVSLSNSVSVRYMKKKPLFSNINSVLFAPHRLRLDLSVLLTTRLMYSIPDTLFHDALAILLSEVISSQDIEAIVNLPPFALTAMISLIKRISKLEKDDIQQGQISRLEVLGIQTNTKPQYSSQFIPTFDSPLGFQFLRDAQRYMAFRFQTTEDDSRKISLPFSELEMEILQQLPDIVTKWCGYVSICKNEKESKLQRWVAFACRHAIFILNKAPSCPPLNGVCRNAKDQDCYLEIVPLLKAANMSLVDLDIVTMGPQVDGRTITNLLRTANLNNVDHQMSSQRRRLEVALKMLNGKVLPFGMGLPNATPASLHWKVSEDIPRPYDKPWQANTRYEQIDSAENANPLAENPSTDMDGTFFVTGDAPIRQYSLGRDGKQSPPPEMRTVSRQNYLETYSNPFANRSPPRVLPSGKEVFKLDDNCPLPMQTMQTDTRAYTPSSSVAIPLNGGPSYVVQEVTLEYSKPPSRAVTPGTWTAGRQTAHGKKQHQQLQPSSSSPNEHRTNSPTSPHTRTVTTIFPTMPTNFDEMKDAVAHGGVLEGDAYDDGVGNEVVPVHELFPLEFHPHSRTPSMNTFNSKINQMLSGLSGTQALSRPASIYEAPAPSNNGPIDKLQTVDDAMQQGVEDAGSLRSLVSISLPSVDGERGQVLSRGRTAARSQEHPEGGEGLIV